MTSVYIYLYKKHVLVSLALCNKLNTDHADIVMWLLNIQRTSQFTMAAPQSKNAVCAFQILCKLFSTWEDISRRSVLLHN